MEEKEANAANLRAPWTKIAIAGVVIIAFAVIAEIFSGYLEEKGLGFTFSSENPHFVYPVIIIAIILFFIARQKHSNITKGKEEQDTKRVLQSIDRLLGKVPKGEIRRFEKSNEAKMYRVVLKRYGVS